MPFVWIGAALIGLSLGLLGSGGSILTVPVLVYLAGEAPKVAIAESLAIVGLVALVGAASALRRGDVDGRSVAAFGAPAMAATYVGAMLSTHLAPALQLVFFAVVLLGAAAGMARGVTRASDDVSGLMSRGRLAAMGVGVGLVTGLVGVGGGFLIVPALALLARLPMRRAVGTSLVLIVANSAVGFVRHALNLNADGIALDAGLIGLMAAVGVGGVLVGGRLGQRLPQATLRRAFAVFLVAMGVFILWRELPGVVGAAPVPVAAVPPSAR